MWHIWAAQQHTYELLCFCTTSTAVHTDMQAGVAASCSVCAGRPQGNSQARGRALYNSLKHTCTHIHPCFHIYIDTHFICTHSHSLSPFHTLLRTHAQSHTYFPLFCYSHYSPCPCPCPRPHLLPAKHTLIHAHKHTCMNAYTHLLKHTQTHTHIDLAGDTACG